MGSYSPDKIAFPDGLDELGLRLGLVRFESESLDDFRRRIYLEAYAPSGPSAPEYRASLSRKLGLFDTPVFSINLAVDGNGEPLAADGRIEVTAGYLYAWHDYANEQLDFKADLVKRDGEYFLGAIHTLFSASSYWTITILDSDYEYKKSNTLAIGTTLQTENEPLDTRLVHSFQHQHLESVLFQNTAIFREEQETMAGVDDYGKFYIDYTNGVVFTNDPMSGSATYTYRQFPYQLVSQAVKSYPLNDADIDHVLKDNLYDTDGQLQPLKLNSRGAKIIDEVLSVHPLEWGK